LLTSFAADEDRARGALHETLSYPYPAAGEFVADHGAVIAVGRA
jgi:hypothetical protein